MSLVLVSIFLPLFMLLDWIYGFTDSSREAVNMRLGRIVKNISGVMEM